MGLPPLKVGDFHLTVSEVAWMSVSVKVMIGEPGAAELKQKH